MVLNPLRNKLVEIVVYGILGRTGLNVINPAVVFNIADNYVAALVTILLVLQLILIISVLEFLLQKLVLVISLAALGTSPKIGHPVYQIIIVVEMELNGEDQFVSVMV
jgi:hypothetical protein